MHQIRPRFFIFTFAQESMDLASTNSADIADCGSRTFLWCVPRSTSTALTKCLSFIEGIEVWFEPFCYCHLAKRETTNQLHVELPPDYHGNEEIFRKAADFMNEVTNCRQFSPDSLP